MLNWSSGADTRSTVHPDLSPPLELSVTFPLLIIILARKTQAEYFHSPSFAVIGVEGAYTLASQIQDTKSQISSIEFKDKEAGRHSTDKVTYSTSLHFLDLR